MKTAPNLKDLIVRIGPFDVNITFVSLNGEMFGDFSYMHSRIRIEKSLRGSILVDTLLHEIFHAMYAVGQLQRKDKEERIVSTFSVLSSGFYRDNPELIKFLLKHSTDLEVLLMDKRKEK